MSDRRDLHPSTDRLLSPNPSYHLNPREQLDPLSGLLSRLLFYCVGTKICTEPGVEEDPHRPYHGAFLPTEPPRNPMFLCDGLLMFLLPHLLLVSWES